MFGYHLAHLAGQELLASPQSYRTFSLRGGSLGKPPDGWWSIVKDPWPHPLASVHWLCFPRLTLLETSAKSIGTLFWPPRSLQPLLACISGFTQPGSPGLPGNEQEKKRNVNLLYRVCTYSPRGPKSPQFSATHGMWPQAQRACPSACQPNLLLEDNPPPNQRTKEK